MEPTGQPEDVSFYTSIQDFLSAPKDASSSPTDYTAKKEAAVGYPPAFAVSVPKIGLGPIGSYQPPVKGSERRERSPPARRDLSPPAGLRLNGSMAHSDSASTFSPASFKRCVRGDDRQQWSVPTWAALSPQQRVRAASPSVERSGLPLSPQQRVRAASPSVERSGLQLSPQQRNRAASPSVERSGLQLQHSPRSVRPGPPAHRAPLAPGCPVHSASRQHQSHVPARVPVMSARDLGSSYRAVSPPPDSATTGHRSYVPPPILSAQDLGGSYPAGRGTSPPPDSVTTRHRSHVPLPVMSPQDLGGSYSASHGSSSPPAPAGRQPRISATSGQSPPQQVQKRCVATAPLSPTAQVERPLPVHERQNEKQQEVTEKLLSHFPAEVKRKSMTKLKDSPEKPNLQKNSVEQISKEKPLRIDGPKEPLHSKLQGMEQENWDLDNTKATEQHLRDRLREVEQEKASLQFKFCESQLQVSRLEQQFGILRRECDAAKQVWFEERLQANKSLRVAEDQCTLFQKRWTEAQEQVDVLVSERDELRERKDQAEDMLRAAIENWENDQQRLVEAEKRLREPTKQLPGRDMVALGDKLAALKATSLCTA